MAKSLNLNHVDTGVEGVSTLTLSKGIINWGADYRVKNQDKGSVILTNLTSPLDKPETYRVAVSNVNDVYKGSGIDPAQYGPTRKGVSMLCALNDVYTVTDSVTGLSYDIPMKGHIVLQVSADALITPAVIETFVGRLLAGLYESGSATTGRMTALLRGSLLPTDL